jgi:RNA polymerase sigma factor (sigma-70 family)
MTEPPPREPGKRDGTESHALPSLAQIWQLACDRALRWKLTYFEAQDVANDVMDRAEEVRVINPKFLPDGEAIRKYTDRVVKNRIRNLSRDSLKRAELDGELTQHLLAQHDEWNAASDDTADERWAFYDGFVDSLGKQCRAIWGMRYVDDMTLPEIATVLGIGVETVKTHLKRGLKKLEARKLAYDTAKNSEKQP